MLLLIGPHFFTPQVFLFSYIYTGNPLEESELYQRWCNSALSRYTGAVSRQYHLPVKPIPSAQRGGTKVRRRHRLPDSMAPRAVSSVVLS